MYNGRAVNAKPCACLHLIYDTTSADSNILPDDALHAVVLKGKGSCFDFSDFSIVFFLSASTTEQGKKPCKRTRRLFLFVVKQSGTVCF